jgi:peptidoglycan lytic transglycosylase G
VARGSKRRSSGAKPPGRKQKSRFLPGCFLLLVLLAVPAAMVGWSWWKIQRPFQGYAGAEKLVSIEPGTGAGPALSHLAAEGILADAKLARFYLIYALGDPPIKAGEYRFRGPLTTPQVLGKLVRGEVATQSITLVEGMTLEETADRLAQGGLGDRAVFLDLMRSPAPVADLDPDAPDLEGYLFPETYTFALHVDERTVVTTLVKTFRERFARQVQPLLAQHPGRSARQVITLASIVEKEARIPSERPLIAGVYSNRLRRGMGLGADPTVIFALKQRGEWSGNIHKSDLQLDSPYNTYRYAGLPPGPICSPGLASLIAAADPAAVPYLYFVSRNDGTHVFASTLEEHNRNVETWQRRYWREHRAAGR